MIQVYVNYPNPKISVHRDALCSQIGKFRKTGQRRVTVNADTLSAELLKFQQKEYKFGATPANNDMWITIDLGDNRHELEALENIQQLVGAHYRPLKAAEILMHCGEDIRDGQNWSVPASNNRHDIRSDYSSDQASRIERQLQQLEDKIRGAFSDGTHI